MIIVIERQYWNYRKNSENKPRGSYFSKALFEGLIFGGAYVRREVCVSKSIWLAYSWKGIYRFCFVLLCIRGQFSKYKPPGALYLEGRFHGGFFVLRVWGAYNRTGLYMEGLIFGILRYFMYIRSWSRSIMGDIGNCFFAIGIRISICPKNVTYLAKCYFWPHFSFNT